MKLFNIKRLGKQLLGFFPTSLPKGMSEFTSWASDIFDTYDMPTDNRDSLMFGVTTMIMHLGPLVDKKPKMYFVRALRAAAAKQIAGAHFQLIKQRQLEATKKAENGSEQS